MVAKEQTVNFNVQGRIDPTDPSAHYLPADPASVSEREQLYRKWETGQLTAEERVRFEELTADRDG